MRVEPYQWMPNQPLARDYVADFSAVASLYEYDPWNENSEKERAAWLDGGNGPRADRGGLVRVLRDYNESIGNTEAALKAIDSFLDPRTLAVVGGQQAGLFTGPLLVLYKAITLLQEARQASQRLGRNVVPVFWIAGEDHDFDEVNHTYVLTDALHVQKIKLDPFSDRRSSVSQLRVPPEAWEDALGQLERSLMDTEFKPQLMERLRGICRRSETLVDQFARTLVSLFGEYGLVFVNSDDPALRRLETDLFRSLVARQRSLSDALFAAKERLEALGYPPQVELQPDQANLFVYHEGERLPLVRRGERYTDRKETVSFTESELYELAGTSPERLSNNVMTRPLMQEYLFPVLSAILGPSEIAYWGMLRPAFGLFGMKMPILVPRMEFTVLEGTVQKQMARYGLTFEDVLFRLDEKKNAWLEAQGSVRLSELFAETKDKFASLYRPVVEAVAAINPGMRKLGETNMQKIVEQIEFLEARAGDAFRSQFDSALRHWERIRLSVLPLGKPQERVYNAFMYLNKYGDGWLKELIDMPLTRSGVHRIVWM